MLTFVIALAAAALLIVPFIYYHGGVFYYYGDFNVQEIPFYQLVHSQVRNGELGWNHLTDLGSDTISSYSFYLLGSPFFWMTIPFPNDFVPYLIGPLLILKFACAAASAYLWLQRYVSFKGYALIGGLLYAFSGFSIYNVFFFHFHEPMIVFPLLLAALDSFLYDKRRGIFAVAVCAACVINYYFFVGQAIFIAIYYLTLIFTKTCKFRLKEFLLLAAEVIIGFCGAMFILLPSVLGLLGNPRLDSYPNGWDALVYDKAQRYWLILAAFFFPSDIPALPTFTPESNCKWASVAGWLPMFGMTGAIAFLQLRKRDWLKKIIVILMLFAAVPVLNSVFQMFNSSIFYTRWFYMPVLLLTLATLRALEDSKADWNRAIIWSVGLTAGMTALIGFMPNLTEEDDGSKSFALGVQADRARFWIYALIALGGLLAFILIYKKFMHNRTEFFVASGLGVLVLALISSFFVIGTGTLESSTTGVIKKSILNQRQNIEVDDLEKVRSDFYKAADNTAMFWKVPSINCFQSSVSPSIMQFYDKLGIKRDVASRPDFTVYGLRPLLSVKYYFDYNKDNGDRSDDKSFVDEDGKTKMPCWSYLKTSNGFDIYENDCYIPMGFCFNEYITEEEFDRVKSSHRAEAMLCALVLTREQMEKYSDITGYTDSKYAALYGDRPENFESIADKFTFGETQYKNTCKKLAENSCRSFEYTKDGFLAEYDNFGSEKLMFFSVPYSDGFKATVNGEEVEVEKVDFGFMAVKIPGYRDCKIEFTYTTPGLKTGVIVSLMALAAYAVYITAVFFYRRKRR